MIAALLTTTFFAATPVFANRAASHLGMTRANFWRLFVALLVLGAWAHTAGSGLRSAALGWFVLGGSIGFGIGGFAMFQSLPRLGSNLSTLLVQCGSAIAAAAVEWAWLGTRLTVPQVAFAGATLTGIAVGMSPAAAREGLSRSGIAWALLSAVAQGVGAVVSRRGFAAAAQAGEQLDPGTAAYLRCIGGLAVAAMALLAIVLLRREPVRHAQAAIPWVLLNALTGPILGVTCYQWALRTTPAGIVQPIVAAAPLLTIGWAAWLEGSRPRPAYFLGAALAVIGVSGLLLWK